MSKKSITGAFHVMVGDRTIRRIKFNRAQIDKVVRDRREPDKETYNEEGAKDRATIELDRWRASDQFIGQTLRLELVDD